MKKVWLAFVVVAAVWLLSSSSVDAIYTVCTSTGAHVYDNNIQVPKGYERWYCSVHPGSSEHTCTFEQLNLCTTACSDCGGTYRSTNPCVWKRSVNPAPDDPIAVGLGCPAAQWAQYFDISCNCYYEPTGPDCSFCNFYTADPQDCEPPPEFEQELRYDETCGCCYNLTTPLLVNLHGGTAVIDRANGVLFDIHGTGNRTLVPWPTGDNDGWLVLDRNGNGMIDSGLELFGDDARLPDGSKAQNGFEALRALDSNRDRVIDQGDQLFAQLKIWIDIDRNGVSGSSELNSLSSLGLTRIDLDYRLSRKRDPDGNLYPLRGKVHFSDGSERYVYDVYFK